MKDGSTDGCAELVLLEVGSRLAGELREEIIRVEDVVADEFPGTPVELIGTGFADEVDVGAAAATVGGVEVGGLDTEFLDGVRCGNGGADFGGFGDGGGVFGEVVGVDSVELNVVGGGGCAVGCDVLGSGAELGGVGEIDDDAGRQAEDLGIVAVGEGEELDGGFVDGTAEGGAFSLDILSAA